LEKCLTKLKALNREVIKVKPLISLCLLALATGCAAPNDKIVFSDDADIRAALVNAATPPVQASLERADELRLEQVIFGYLLELHFWDLADYSAVFVQADDTEVAAMIKKYPNHNPPIKQSSRALIKSHQTPIDKDTSKPAMILSAEVNEPNADGTVDAIGRWYAGDAVTGFRAFHLKKVDGDWQILDVK
jgi:hypothetical protein